MITAGLGIGLVPSFARHRASDTSITWLPVDSPDCRRTVTLYWRAGNNLPTAARLMHTTLTIWSWHTDGPPGDQ